MKNLTISRGQTWFASPKGGHRFARQLTRPVQALCLLLALGGVPALALLGQPATAEAAESALGPLLARFKACPGMSADFVEDKQIALLAVPLTSRGKLYFTAPGKLARLVEAPSKSQLVVSGQRIVIKDESGKREVDLSDKPPLRALVGSLLHVLSGDEARLRQDFELRFAGEVDKGWNLSLVPREESLKKLVTSFELRGKGLALEQLVVREASGDVTTTRFSVVDTARRFSDDEKRRIFEP